MKKSYTTPILIVSIIILIATILVFIFVLKVIKNKNQHASVVLTTLEDKLIEKENAIANNSKIEEIKSIQNTINNYFVDKNQIDVFVSYLEGIGSKMSSVVSVESIEVSPKSKDIISIKISIVGNFNKVMNTIAFIENIPYQVDITQIYLNKNEKQTKNPTWQANVSFNILNLN